MSLNNIKIVDINTDNIASSDFGSNSEVDVISSNLDAFASYANSTFSTGPSFEAGQLLNTPILYTDASNANSAYATSNVIALSTAVNSGDNLLVYLDGLLQHPDTYTLSGTTLQFTNVEPLPANVTVGIRYLQTGNLVVDSSTANSLVGANGMLAWDYENKRLYIYDGITEGGFYADATLTFGYSFQGTVSGYTSGGRNPSTLDFNTIDKFSFSSDGSATDVGDVTQGRHGSSGQTSEVSGYTSGGAISTSYINIIDKFPFAVDANATDVGDLLLPARFVIGQSSSVSGYSSGGQDPSGNVNTIEKFPFSSDSNSSDVGDLTVAKGSTAGQSSTTSGYVAGGGGTSTIDKFPFATDANATAVGNLTLVRFGGAGQSSTTSGYTSGGNFPLIDTIDKFPFASDGNATDVGNLTQARGTIPAGQSSSTEGYTSGGALVPTSSNVIDKFPFSTDSNATDVGDLTQGRNQGPGQQV